MTLFKHDCDKCTTLGEFNGHDLYWCKDSVLARYGNGGPEYQSTSMSIARNVLDLPELHEAWKRFLATPKGKDWQKRYSLVTVIYYARGLEAGDFYSIKDALEAKTPIPSWAGNELRQAIEDLLEVV